MVTLPLHTIHALQPLDVTCFKSFKVAFKKNRDSWGLANNDRALEKEDIVEWVSIASKSSMTIQNIKKRFFVTRIWPLNNKAIEKIYMPYSLESNKDDVGVQTKSESKFDGDNDIEDSDLDHEVTNDEHSWLVELQHNNDIQSWPVELQYNKEVVERDNALKWDYNYFLLGVNIFEIILQSQNQMSQRKVITLDFYLCHGL